MEDKRSEPMRAAPRTPRQFLKLPKPSPLPFSDAVLAGDTLYLAGRIGLDPKTGKPPAEVEEEVRSLLEQFQSVLAEFGMSMDDLVFVQVFCPDLSLYTRFNQTYQTYFGKDYPARAFLGSGPLLFNARFEMNGIAVKR